MKTKLSVQNAIYKLNKQNVTLFVFGGGSEDLIKLDLSELNLAFHKMKTADFRAKLVALTLTEKALAETNDFFHDYEYSLPSHIDSIYVLSPIHAHQTNNPNNVALVRACLLLMFPSDFYIIGDITFIPNSKDGGLITSFTSKQNYRHNSLRQPKYLTFGDTSPNLVNAFMHTYLKRNSCSNYLDIAIQSYYNSFFQDEMRLCFTTLFICLEAITQASSEITHQISRYCAVINSDTKKEGHIIYDNAKKLYTLRSKIVHGDSTTKANKVKASYFHLEMLASRTLIELLSHDISDKKVLTEKINESGFGEKRKLSPGYHDFQIRAENTDELLLQKL